MKLPQIHGKGGKGGKWGKGGKGLRQHAAQQHPLHVVKPSSVRNRYTSDLERRLEACPVPELVAVSSQS